MASAPVLQRRRRHWAGLSCHNIEWLEANFPLLYLFRRNTKGGAGAGKFRGGTGSESALTTHDAPKGKIQGVALGVAGLRNSGQGIFGGYPGAPSLLMLIQGARVTRKSPAPSRPISSKISVAK